MMFSRVRTVLVLLVLPVMFLHSPDVRAAAPSGPVQFVDFTDESGIRFHHFNAATEDKFMVETMGSGGGMFDYDGDGDLDIYFVNGAPLPGSELPSPAPANALYRNDGMARFSDVTERAGVGDTGFGMGLTTGDVDNDGDVDLYVTNFGPNVFYLNRGDGSFVDATDAAGLREPEWSTSAAFADYDADGNLDLYVGRYVDFDLDNNKFCGNLAKNIKAYCHPDVYDPLPGILFRGRGDGTFVDVTEQAGVYVKADGKSLGVVWGDYDNDGDADLYVANDSMRNFLFQNQLSDGDATFKDVTLLAGVGYSEDGQTQAGMGTDMADVNGDGFMDLTVTNLDFEYNALYEGSESGIFSDSSYNAGLAEASLNFVGFGTFFFDYDHDGWEDVFVANGHIIDNIDQFNNVSTYRERNFLFRNRGMGIFEEQGGNSGTALLAENVARGAMPGDLDGDADQDVLVTRCGGPALLLRNDGAEIKASLRLHLVGVRSNRDAVGVRATVRSGGRDRFAEVKTGRSYLSQGELTLHFGLETGNADAVELIWSNGEKQDLGAMEAGEWLVVEGRAPVRWRY